MADATITTPTSATPAVPTQVQNPTQAQSSTYVAPTLYGPNGQIAKPSDTTTKDQVDSALKSGWTTIAPKETSSDQPSSSASIPLQVKSNNATETSTSSELPKSPNAASAASLSSMLSSYGITSPAAATDIQNLMDSGMSTTDAVNMLTTLSGVKDAKDTAAQASGYQKATYDAETAANNASYSSAWAQLEQHRADAKNAATAQLASLNSSGGISSDSSQFLSHVDAMYDLAQNQLNLQAKQAQAALDSGNAQAYAAINASMANTISQVKTNVSNLLSAMQGQQISAANTAKAEQDKSAALYRDTLTQLPLAQATNYASLPSDISALSADQLDKIKGTTAYQQGHAAGLSDQAILTDLRTLSTTPSFKQQQVTNAANEAAARLAISQANLADKESAQIDANTLASQGATGKSFLSAFQNASAGGGHTKDENQTALSAIADYVQSGDTENAKIALTNYVLAGAPAGTKTIIDGLRQTQGQVQSLMEKINALPKDQQTGLIRGTFQSLAAKLGQNPDPKMQILGAEFGHMQVLYNANVFGKRAVISNNAILNNLFPNIKDNPSLNVSTLQGLLNTANDTINAEVRSKIGATTFDSIYGKGGVLNMGTSGNATQGGSSSQPTAYQISGQTINVGQQVKFSDGKVGTLGADGKFTF